mmetsp:Transcript_11463/g.26896  ORF Transcript_11463/g.26896 Transcript_11463/m.26896 type:complete len:217 (+) Transcript_11463:431-1081(+)
MSARRKGRFPPLGGFSIRFSRSSSGAPLFARADLATEEVPVPSAPVTTMGPFGGLASMSRRRRTAPRRGKGPAAWAAGMGEASRRRCVSGGPGIARLCWMGLLRQTCETPTIVAEARTPLRPVRNIVDVSMFYVRMLDVMSWWLVGRASLISRFRYSSWQFEQRNGVVWHQRSRRNKSGSSASPALEAQSRWWAPATARAGLCLCPQETSRPTMEA